MKTEIGLPVYAPNLGPPTESLRGSRLVTHTFDASFLPQLLTIGRKHGVKLASLLNAALLKAVTLHTDSPPSNTNVLKTSGAIDLRNGWLQSPYGTRKEYVNLAVAVNQFE